MKKLIYIIFLLSMPIYPGPREWLLKQARVVHDKIDAAITKSKDVVEDLLKGSKHRELREKLIANEDTLQKIMAELADDANSPDAVDRFTKQLKKVRLEQEQLLIEIKKQKFPLEVLNKLNAAFAQKFPEIDALLEQLDQRDELIKMYAQVVTKATREGINASNPYKDKPASAEQAGTLVQDEVAYREKRKAVATKGLEKFFGNTKQDGIYAFVGTGGGYRAMILTMGYLLALEEVGLLDATYYISSLSGSTWLLAPWIYEDKTMKEYQEVILDKVEQGQFNLLKLSRLLKGNIELIANDAIWPKFVFGQPVGSIDVYGALLAYVFFSQFGDQRQRMHLTDQWDKVKDGSKPFPLYTAVSDHKNDTPVAHYDWYEFNPLMVTNITENIRIPAYAFGSEFKDGKTVTVAPQQSMGFLLGIFGSAYTVNVKDLAKMFKAKVQQASDSLGKIKVKVLSAIFGTIQDVKFIGKVRALPADVYNPLEGYSGAPNDLRPRKLSTFIDAGIDYNIPVLPVLQKERGVSVVFIGESSASAERPNELNKTLAAIKGAHGYEYVRSDDGKSKSLRILKAPQEGAPIIIYVNFFDDVSALKEGEKNPALKTIIDEYNLAGFDVKACLKKVCGTFNFEYSTKDIRQLAGTAYFNMMTYMPKIKEALAAQ